MMFLWDTSVLALHGIAFLSCFFFLPSLGPSDSFALILIEEYPGNLKGCNLFHAHHSLSNAAQGRTQGVQKNVNWTVGVKGQILYAQSDVQTLHDDPLQLSGLLSTCSETPEQGWNRRAFLYTSFSCEWWKMSSLTICINWAPFQLKCTTGLCSVAHSSSVLN